jgi:hypothetical protein
VLRVIDGSGLVHAVRHLRASPNGTATATQFRPRPRYGVRSTRARKIASGRWEFDLSDPTSPPPKTMRLRYPGHCVVCGIELSVGAIAVYSSSTKSVTCLVCPAPRSSVVPPSQGSDVPAKPNAVETSLPELVLEQSEVFVGVAGGSAQREYERRKGKRESRIREAHPRIGGLILALSDDPQSTKAWATGAQGEERLGRQLDAVLQAGVHVLHDRRIPTTKANIDHIVVCPSGVFVIDAKKYQGQRPSLRIDGGWTRPRTETLIIGSRNGTKLVDGVHKQVDLVRAAVETSGLKEVQVGGMLCFVDADWPLFGGDFMIDEVSVLWPRKAASHIGRPGAIDAATAARIHHVLALSFPPA